MRYKRVYIYRDSRFPDNGWMQPCFKCYAPTAGIYELESIRTRWCVYEINVYVCECCKKVFETKKDEYVKFLQRCADYMEENIRFS